jgi:hypothetical protein
LALPARGNSNVSASPRGLARLSQDVTHAVDEPPQQLSRKREQDRGGKVGASIFGSLFDVPSFVTPSFRTIVLAVPPGYLKHIRTFRFLRGSLRSGEIVFDQQLAATLRVQPGDTVVLTPRPGAAPRRFRVSGVAIVTAPDVLFQPLNPLLGPAPAQPPANIAILPVATFARTLAPSLRTISPASSSATAIPGTPTGIQWQVQAQVDPHALGGSPAHALKRAGQVPGRVTGTGQLPVNQPDHPAAGREQRTG